MHRTSFPPIRWIRWKVPLQPLVNRWLKGRHSSLFYDEHSERNDKRFVADAVTYSYGLGGYRQEITLGAEDK